MCVEFHQTKKGLSSAARLFHESDGAVGDVVVDGLHALFGQRAGVLDAAVGEGVDDAARARQQGLGQSCG